MIFLKILEMLLGNNIEQIDTYAYAVLVFIILIITSILKFILSLICAIFCLLTQNEIYKIVKKYNFYILVCFLLIDYMIFKYFLISYMGAEDFIQEKFLYYILLFSLTIIYLPFFIAGTISKIIKVIFKKI